MAKCFLVTALLLDFVLSKEKHFHNNMKKNKIFDMSTNNVFERDNNIDNTDKSIDRIKKNIENVDNNVDNNIDNDIDSHLHHPNFHWRYNVEYEWPGRMCRHGMGGRQSPIDIVTANLVRDSAHEFIKYGPLKFKAYDNVLVSAINNGHTLQFSTEGDPAMHPTLTGGPLKHQYRLEQLHFHWLSEHAVNGQKYPMELHFVHVRSDLDVERALKEADGLAIIAVFCNVLSQFADRKNAVDDDLMQHIPSLINEGSRISGVVMDLNKLLSSDKTSYYTYAGSLTTPQCNEAVIWILFEMPIYMTDEQYRFFGKTGIGYNNFRSIQPLDKHIVYATTGDKDNLYTPAIVKAMSHFAQTIKQFFMNITSFLSRGLKEKDSSYSTYS
ncbi:carbonic anhydrase 2 [Amyelois transitella]|uniref:carbonic anhydrase 2 n=1 Tax=Amyelois transitella TaxID=680683 RepID=UPI00298FB18D|nr:carbonic anhydrase 2 [Amyelois transitella]